MTHKQTSETNRRDNMRVQARLHFCVSIIEGINQKTGTYTYDKCFCTTSADISLGGICIAHNGELNVGFDVEISTPEKMTRPECISCEKAFLYTNELELQPIIGKVVWSTGNRCGISFKKMTVRNENILSKFIWDEHLNDVRSVKQQVTKQRKF
ncbi:MAG: hypothetical protein C0602_07150 [Denitrovibrio sp.]|nr:MAG: hypothetical protein C0602_07150 [Denitrovibrio sp.]